jgi:hypothetical protein
VRVDEHAACVNAVRIEYRIEERCGRALWCHGMNRCEVLDQSAPLSIRYWWYSNDIARKPGLHNNWVWIAVLIYQHRCRCDRETEVSECRKSKLFPASTVAAIVDRELYREIVIVTRRPKEQVVCTA